MNQRHVRGRKMANEIRKSGCAIVRVLVAGVLFTTIACSNSEIPGSTTAPLDRSSITTSAESPMTTRIPATEPSPTVAPQPTDTPLPTVEQIISLTAVELYGEREANATRYDVQYKGKSVRIKGFVGKIDGGQISLVVDHAAFSLLDTTFLESIELHDLPINDQVKANKGEGFEAVCTVGDYILGSIQLRDCTNGKVVQLSVETSTGSLLPQDNPSSTAGTLMVGKEIEPGRYKTEVADGLVPLCYWARLSDTDGEMSSIIANNAVVEGSVYVTIKPSDFAFESRGCTDWQPQDDNEIAATKDQVELQTATATPSATPLPPSTSTPTTSLESSSTPTPTATPTVEHAAIVTPSATPLPPSTSTPTTSLESSSTPTPTATPTVEHETSPTVDANQTTVGLGPGTYLVGSEIQPGRYKAEVAPGSFGCSWSRLSDTDGELSSIIAISLIVEGQTYATIKGSDFAFETSGCTDFVPQTDETSQSSNRTEGFGPGTYLVGLEIQPGRYRTEVAPSSFGCSWSRLSDTDGELSSIIAISLIVEGQTYATIKDSDFAFETSGCTDFVPQTDETSKFGNRTEGFGPGTYLVGLEIQPGQYRADVAPNSFGCSWSRLSETDGELSSVVAIDIIVEGQTYVTVVESDLAFETSGCTNWEQQESRRN